MKEKFFKIICVCLCLVMVLSLAACGNSNTKDDNATNGTHMITDHEGNEVAVPNEINNIVVCDILPLPSVLSIFFDSGSKIVGMSPGSMSAAKSGLLGELYPELLDAKTDFINGTSVNTEELLKLNPDIVFYSTQSPELGEQLRNAGLCAVAISANNWGYNAIETLNQWIALLSEIFPANDKKDIDKEYSENIASMVADRVKDIKDEDRAKAFFLYKYDDTNIMTSGANFFGQYWCDAIGAKNVANEMTNDNQVKVTMEQIYKWNPDLIFITNFTTALPEDLYNNSIGVDDWSPVDAVANKNVHKMPLGMYRSYTCGVDTPITLLWCAKTAYPERFKDVDITEEVIKYYNEVFGIELSKEQAEKIFVPVKEAGNGILAN